MSSRAAAPARPIALAGSPTLAVYAGAIFLGSALLFLIEPMTAKMLLPSFGGAPAVWAVSLVFFQAVLLAGYAFAHVTFRFLSVRRQPLLQLALLVAPLPLLPIAVPSDAAPPDGASPALWLIGVLAVAVGAPFFVVTTASPVLQRWFAASGHRASGDPYFLYAASNAGSLVGLLAYPLIVEPTLTLDGQARLWLAGYGVFAVATALCARRVLATASEAAPPFLVTKSHLQSQVAARIPWRRRVRWVALAALPSSLMLGTTSHLSTSIASVPLLWVIPLALYLVSFIVAFARRAPSPAAVSRLTAVSALLALATILHVVELPIAALVAIHAGNLFCVALLVHRRLALERPGVERLTEFYLLLSLGGVLGGIFNALLAPQLFDSIAEYPLALVLGLLLRPGPRGFDRSVGLVRRTADYVLPLVLLCGTVAAVGTVAQADSLGDGAIRAVLAAAVGALVLFARRPVRFALGVGALLLLASLGQQGLHSERTFFGVMRVAEDGHQHVFAHGTTLHGVEDFSRGRLDVPLSYYTREGPIGQVFAARRRHAGDVAVIGLGTGAIAAYGEPGDRYTFYELDPAVARIAENPRYFTFLADSNAQVNVVVGDGRLELAHASAHGYDLLVLDAFSSDAVPVHLLTREAVELYLSKLDGSGLLAFHITNEYLDLEPVVAGVAESLGLVGLVQSHHPTPAAERGGARRSKWVALARDRAALGSLAGDPRWRPLRASGDPVWTDRFSNILSAVKWAR